MFLWQGFAYAYISGIEGGDLVENWKILEDGVEIEPFVIICVWNYVILYHTVSISTCLDPDICTHQSIAVCCVGFYIGFESAVVANARI